MVAGLILTAPVPAAAGQGPVGVTATGTGSATALCPPGSTVYGTAGNSRSGIVTAIRPNPQLTSVTVTGGGTADRVTAYATCGQTTAVARLVTATGVGAATARCPDQTTLYGTGGAVGGFGFLTGVTPDSALTSVVVAGNGTGQTVTAHAICRSAMALTLVVATSKYNADAPKSVTSSCPGGLNLFNGGGSIMDGNDMIALSTVLSPYFDSVTATGHEVGPGLARWSVTAFATCG